MNADGQLETMTDLDYETVTSYEFVVRCVSAFNESLSNETSVNITILPVNEFRPQVSAQSRTVVINETTPPGTILISTLHGAISSYSVKDLDSGPDGNIFYSIGSSTNNDSFAFNTSIGSLTLSQSIDLEAINQSLLREIFQITVCDSDPPTPDCLNIEVSVIVLGVNEFQPVFNQSNYTVSYPESVTTGTLIATAPCFDGDIGVGAFGGIEITSRIPPLTPAGTFIINSLTGDITLGGQLDYEFTDRYELQLRCFDMGNPPMTDFATVVINVSDTNDNAPTIEVNIPNVIVINDNSTINSSVFLFACSDLDSGQNSDIVYSISNGSSLDLFSINATSGEVTVFNPLSLPSSVYTVEHTLVLECSDNGQPSLSNQAQLRVSIYKNDNTPPSIDMASISNGVVSVLENSTEGTPVVSVIGVDNTSPNLTYFLENESSPGTFVIDPISGVISLNQFIDRENIAMYTVRVVVTEVRIAPGNPASGFADLTIQVGDVNDNSPFVDVNTSDVIVLNDNVTVGSPIFTLQCSDEDSGRNELVTYSLSNSSAMDAFMINNSTGVVEIANPLSLPSSVYTVEHTLVLECRDNGQPSLSNQAQLRVSIYKNDNSPPSIDMASISNGVVSVLENSTGGTPVVSVMGVDNTSPNLTYSLENESSPGTFVIDPISGVISLNGLIDRENIAMYTVRVVVTEVRIAPGNPASGFADLTIQVGDVNDNSPFVEVNTSDVIVLNDNVTVGSPIFTLQCSDEDTGRNELVTYSLSNSSAIDAFMINNSTGVVEIANPLSLPSSVYTVEHTLVLECSDNGQPSLSNQAQLRVSIYKNDNTPPSIDMASISNGVVSVLENSTGGTPVVSVMGVDNTSPNLTYSLENESSPGTFVIDPISGVISLNQMIDRENIAMYTVRVVVTEVRIAPGNPASGFADLTIQVGDVNDNNPMCVQESVQTLLIGTHSYERIVILNCNDSDAGVNSELTYSSPNLPVVSEGEFVLNEQTGEVGFTGTLTQTTVYTIPIVVSDSGLSTLSTALSLQVNVTEPSPTVAPTPGSIPIYVIIVPIVGGLLIILCFILLLCCCCYCCNRRRVDKRRKDLLR